MRVLHVTQSLGAGVESAIRQYIASTPEVEHSVLAVERHGERGSGQMAATIQLAGSTLGLSSQLPRLAARNDVVHLHSSIAGAVGRALPRPRTAQTVYSPHALSYLAPGRPLRSTLFKNVEGLLAARATAYGAVSPHEKLELQKLGIDSGRIVPVPHCVHIPVSPKERKDRRPLVLAIGRIASQKDPELFRAIVVAARNHGELRELEWAWVGDGDPERVASLREVGVHVTGWLPTVEVQRWMATATVALHTARYEGLPISLAECLAAGTPIVARQIPALEGLPIHFFTSVPESIAALNRLFLHHEHWADESLAGRNYAMQHFTRACQNEALQELYGI